MRSIWKFPLPVGDFVAISMPAGARVLTVQTQGINACLWALVDTDAPRETRRFRVFGTGHPVEGVEVDSYVGTIQQLGGALVWHVFEAEEGGRP